MGETIKDIVNSLRNCYDIPAVSVAYLHNDGHTCFAVGDKTRTKGDQRHKADSAYPTSTRDVNENTLFGIGSLSKGFTSLLVAIVLQSNQETCRITWDTPIKNITRNHFDFGEDYRSENACLRDILSHQMGIELGETDFAYIMGNIERNSITRNLKYLPFAADFRKRMMYNNFMYALAGNICEELTGKPYEVLMKENIFNLLEMDNTTFLDQVDIAKADIATPHVGIDDISTPVDFEVHRQSSSVAPAASICSSAKDMTKWMEFLLKKGKIGDVQIVNKSLLEECWKPQFALPMGKMEWDGYVSKPAFPVTETRDTYGFGWYMGTYRGYRTIAHSGELFGYDCLLTLFPDMNIGIYTNINGPGGEKAYIVNQVMHYYIADLLLGYEPWLNKNNATTFPEPWRSRDMYIVPKVKSAIIDTFPLTNPLDVYIGVYKHGFLGHIDICNKNGKLYFKMGDIGRFVLHPNGTKDEFRMEGDEHLEFLHKWDLYSPSDWMIVHFSVPDENLESLKASSLCCSLFESGPVFCRV